MSNIHVRTVSFQIEGQPWFGLIIEYAGVPGAVLIAVSFDGSKSYQLTLPGF